MTIQERFLRDLFLSGQVELPLWREEGMLWNEAETLLRDREAQVRLEIPGQAPSLMMEVAQDACGWFFGACQMYLQRGRDSRLLQGWVEEGLEKWAPVPEVVYSVDLVLSYLPDLWIQARHHAEDDGLMQVLRRLAEAWPLSSVGIEGLEIRWDRLESWWGHRGLRQWYVDRIIERDDRARLDAEEVMGQVRASLGEHGRELSGSG